MSVTLTSTGGIPANATGGSTSGISNNGLGTGNLPIISFNAVQIGGLVKMIPCGFVDCRANTPKSWCYSLPVFGHSPDTKGTYRNDLNSFPVSFSGTGTPGYVIQKMTSFFDGKSEVYGTWNNVVSITNNTYGIYQPLGSIPGHPTYMNFTVNWGAVVALQGAGYYRIIFQSCVTTTTPGTGWVQAITNGDLTPFAATDGFFGSPPVSFVQCFCSIKCGAKTYTCPTFNVSASSSLSELNSILAALNGWFTANNLPFTAIVWPLNPTTGFLIQGTNYAAQNGCTFFFNYNFLSSSGTIVGKYYADNQVLNGGKNGTSPTITTTCTCGLASPQFRLLAWDCMRAHGTVKFECWNQGTIGDVNNPGTLVDLCGLSLYDSIRIEGFFGYNKYSYDEILLEYGQGTKALFGTIERVRDKAIPAYKFNSKPLPAFVHKQLATILMMADTILVSDYNINNADYFIQQKQVIKKGNYEPKYVETGKHYDLSMQEYGRRDKVSLEFLEGIQSVIKSTCCLSAIN